jgi:hypothetical protein
MKTANGEIWAICLGAHNKNTLPEGSVLFCREGAPVIVPEGQVALRVRNRGVRSVWHVATPAQLKARHPDRAVALEGGAS